MAVSATEAAPLGIPSRPQPSDRTNPTGSLHKAQIGSLGKNPASLLLLLPLSSWLPSATGLPGGLGGTRSYSSGLTFGGASLTPRGPSSRRGGGASRGAAAAAAAARSCRSKRVASRNSTEILPGEGMLVTAPMPKLG